MATTSNEPRHPIQIAARRSGVSPDTIRAWERRYGAVEPQRSGTNRRLYSDLDVERLTLLRAVIQAGRRISDVASLPLEELQRMSAADRQAAVGLTPPSAPATAEGPDDRHLEVCLAAIERLDGAALSAALEAAALELPRPALLSSLLMPLMARVGELWHAGALRVAHEHLTSSIVHSFLGTLHRCSPVPDSAPELIVAAPAGQHHELGAMTVTVAAATDGWRVTYLGANLPAEEIAAAARARQVRTVALSLVYPADDPRLGEELRALRRGLGAEAALIAGGSAAASYGSVLAEVEATRIDDIAELRSWLATQRTVSGV